MPDPMGGVVKVQLSELYKKLNAKKGKLSDEFVDAVLNYSRRQTKENQTALQEATFKLLDDDTAYATIIKDDALSVEMIAALNVCVQKHQRDFKNVMYANAEKAEEIKGDKSENIPKRLNEASETCANITIDTVKKRMKALFTKVRKEPDLHFQIAKSLFSGNNATPDTPKKKEEGRGGADERSTSDGLDSKGYTTKPHATSAIKKNFNSIDDYISINRSFDQMKALFTKVQKEPDLHFQIAKSSSTAIKHEPPPALNDPLLYGDLSFNRSVALDNFKRLTFDQRKKLLPSLIYDATDMLDMLPVHANLSSCNTIESVITHLKTSNLGSIRGKATTIVFVCPDYPSFTCPKAKFAVAGDTTAFNAALTNSNLRPLSNAKPKGVNYTSIIRTPIVEHLLTLKNTAFVKVNKFAMNDLYNVERQAPASLTPAQCMNQALEAVNLDVHNNTDAAAD